MPESAVDAWLQSCAERARADHDRQNRAANDARAEAARSLASATSADTLAAAAHAKAVAFEAEIARRAPKPAPVPQEIGVAVVASKGGA